LLASVIIGAVLYPELPARMAVHWNTAGRPDAYASRMLGICVEPLVGVTLYILLCVLPLIDPRVDSHRRFAGSLQTIKVLQAAMCLVLQVCAALAAMGRDVNIGMVCGLNIAVMFIVLGNVMGRFRPNYVMGIRTPWTLADPAVWRRTHRFAGPVWVLAGMAMLPLSAFSGRFLFASLLACTAVAAIVPTVYSYRVFRRIRVTGSAGRPRGRRMGFPADDGKGQS
jgi:uncharacterized membrane protein